jgi:Zn-finger protein
MNERIEKLAEQAEDAVFFVHPSDYYMHSEEHNKWLEKFAESIIKECADIAQQHNKSPVAAPLAIGYVIREYFGVE